MEVMLSEKGKNLLVIDGYKFRFHRNMSNNIQRWACTSKSCRSILKINDKNEIIEKIIDHNHNVVEGKILNRQKVSNSLKRKAVDDISCRPSKLLNSQLRQGDVETLTVSDIRLIRNNINVARRSQIPKLPKTLDETHDALDNFDAKTNRGESFLLVNDRIRRIVVFSTISNLQFLCSKPEVFMDGTFYSCPKYFSQVFTIHVLSNNIYIPLVFFLLPGKYSNVYCDAFEILQSECIKLNLAFFPKTIFVDFEMGIHSAIRKIFPEVLMKGCRFHLGQSWWRKIQELGLTTEYKNINSEIGTFLKKFFGLPFLEPSHVDDCFTEDLMSIQPKDKRVEDFCDYIFETYIAENSAFPPCVWANFSSTILRTTNGCESFHAKFSDKFYSSKPNIFLFIEALLDVQCEIYIKIRSKQEKSSKTMEKEKYLREHMLLFNANQMSRADFVTSVSKKFLPICN